MFNGVNLPTLSDTVRSDHAHADHIARWREEAEYQAAHPPAGDVRIGAFSQAHADLLAKDPYYESYVLSLLGHRLEKMQTWYAHNLWLRGNQHALLFYDDAENYPYDYDNPDVYQKALVAMMEQDQHGEGSKVLRADMYWRQTQSNVAERYKTLKLLAFAYPERFDRELRILDVGCSQNQGLKKLALQDEAVRKKTLATPEAIAAFVARPRLRLFANRMGFDPISVQVESHPAGVSVIDSPSYADIVNDVLADRIKRPFRLGASLGIDLGFLPDDRENMEWAKSCSFYPSELLQRDLVDTYDTVDALKSVANVGYEIADITKNDDIQKTLKPKAPFDIVFISFVAYQLSRKKRRQMIDNALSLTAEDGMVVVQDHALLDSAYPEHLIFPDKWGRDGITCRTFIVDKKDSTKSFQEFCAWDNGRCRKLFLSAGNVAIVNSLNAA